MTRVPVRSSLRSRDSSSTSTGTDPREKAKDCCRKLVAFMCTQVGVGGLVVGYAIVGAFGFSALEGQEGLPNVCIRNNIHRDYASRLWQKTAGNHNINVLDMNSFIEESDNILKELQKNFTSAAKEGRCGMLQLAKWDFTSALMFCLSIFTMIGYGVLVPRTPWGKGATVIYAVFGIPLYVLYFLNMGKVLAETFKWFYRWLHECSGQKRPGEKITVPSTACLWVLFAYIVVGTIMFAIWEEWDPLDSAYFCVTSLCKLGIGDFVPGWSESDGNSSQTKLIINFIYLLLGMGLIAMCYNLMKEDVRVKARELKENLNHALDSVHRRTLLCCRSSSTN
ncbi:TWiK family of potassium channels protein 18 [Prorops nasuta]|uniref:TWiK family of potassium channels protein 18 n=1 Tax=Prorops nasuta TaxID=863751 RepID=UPI0034CFB41D